MTIIPRYQSLLDYIISNKDTYGENLTISEAKALFMKQMNDNIITDITPIHRNPKTNIFEPIDLDRNTIESSIYEYLNDPDFCEQDIIENSNTEGWTKSDFIHAHCDRDSFFVIDDHIYAKKL